MIRSPAVDGSFYPAQPATLQALVDRLLQQVAVASPRQTEPVSAAQLRGILVPHAGLEWSGAVAAAGWRALADAVASPAAPYDATVVILGTNHTAPLHGAGLWPDGAWRTPLGDVTVDAGVAAAISELGAPFQVDPSAHLREHSIEVQLPLLQSTAPGVRIVPLAVSGGTGQDTVEAGVRLGRLIAGLDRRRKRILLAISTDLAHYPAHRDCAQATEALLPSILTLDPVGVAQTERDLIRSGVPGLACGMCGIEPTVLGLAALRAMDAASGLALAAATSADAGGPADRTVGYLAVAFS